MAAAASATYLSNGCSSDRALYCTIHADPASAIMAVATPAMPLSMAKPWKKIIQAQPISNPAHQAVSTRGKERDWNSLAKRPRDVARLAPVSKNRILADLCRIGRASPAPDRGASAFSSRFGALRRLRGDDGRRSI